MADGEVIINTKMDTKGVEDGTKKVNKELQDLQKNVNKASKTSKDYSSVLNEVSGSAGGLATKLKSAAAAGGGWVAAAVAVIAVAKKYCEAIRETAEAYKVQERAEQSLAVAAKNNPYINDENVKALKDYASELQKISNIGDEVSIQLMTQLVSNGRTQEEIQKIMSAAADYAAATQTDIKSAVQTLNATYSGMSGTLGRQIDGIKDLTEEELKNGKAVDIIAEKYKGLASTMADAGTQAKNAKGDYLEAWGKLTAPTVNLWDNFWKGFYEAGVERVNKINELLETASRKWGGTKSAVAEGVGIINTTYTNKQTGETRGGEKLQTTEYLKWLEKELQWKKNLTAEENQALIYVSAEIKYRERLAKYEAEEAEKEKQRTEELKKQNAAKQEADDLAKASNKALDDELKKLEVEARAKGTSVSAQDAKKALDEETDSQKKLQAAIEATNAVIKTLQDMSINPTPTNALQQQIDQYKEIRDHIKAMSEEEIEAGQKGNDIIYTKQQLIDGLNQSEVELEKAKVAELTAIEGTWHDKYKDQQQQLLELKKSVDESEVLSEEEKEAAKFAIDEKYAKNKAELWNEVATQINGYVQQTADIAKEAGDLMLENLESQTNTELMELEKKYEAGEMSEEEYYEKQKQIQQKAAREEYKIKMFQWTASMLAATANIAEGVSKAIAQGGVAGIVTGALVAAAGGVQLASIIASKPTPPNFYQGGVIGGMNGATMGSDNTYIHARAGEMVLNANQQRNLWDMINGQGGRGETSLDLTVNNTQSNKVDTQFREEDGAVILDIVDKRVNKGFIDGTFDGGYATMLARQEGERIL